MEYSERNGGEPVPNLSCGQQASPEQGPAPPDDEDDASGAVCTATMLLTNNATDTYQDNTVTVIESPPFPLRSMRFLPDSPGMAATATPRDTPPPPQAHLTRAHTYTLYTLIHTHTRTHIHTLMFAENDTSSVSTGAAVRSCYNAFRGGDEAGERWWQQFITECCRPGDWPSQADMSPADFGNFSLTDALDLLASGEPTYVWMLCW